MAVPDGRQAGGQPYLGNDAAKALQNAEKQLKDFGDEFVTVEHILLGILAGSDKTAQILKGAGFDEGGADAARVVAGENAG